MPPPTTITDPRTFSAMTPPFVKGPKASGGK
jgi:hypothetical protein